MEDYVELKKKQFQIYVATIVAIINQYPFVNHKASMNSFDYCVPNNNQINSQFIMKKKLINAKHKFHVLKREDYT